jgi:ankyrin repeat protein
VQRLTNTLNSHTLHNVSKPEIARLLIANGADVNAESREGVTPLMHAIMNWDSNHAPFVEIADLLVDAGARLDLKSSADPPWPLTKEALQRHLRELAERHKK